MYMIDGFECGIKMLNESEWAEWWCETYINSENRIDRD